MVTLLFEVSLPVLIAFVIFQARRDLRFPARIAFGCIIPKVCVVNVGEIKAFCRKVEELGDMRDHLERSRHWKQLRICWAFLHEMSCNTRLFQGAVLFEQMKIDPAKSALDYERRETLIMELVPEAAEVRMELYKRKVNLVARTIVGLRPPPKVLMELLGAYKQLEEDIIALAGMAEDTCYRNMLIENLGLTEWRLFDGGNAEPGPA